MSAAQEEQQLILVSGLSGAGKSTALKALEDQGYYCLDNLPAALLDRFAQQIRLNPVLYSRVALGIDARSPGPELEDISDWLTRLREEGVRTKLVFLTAGARVLIKTHPETRLGYRRGYFGAPLQYMRVSHINDNVSVWDLLDGAIAVYTVSSHLGFEAILAGRN